jgi:MEDS: MEthanogen/methylotroph, DcmR Sensory domain
MAFNLRELPPAVLEPRVGTKDDHFVEIYEDESALIDSVGTFLSLGLRGGEATVVIATPGHRRAIEDRLAERVDLDVARRDGFFESMDAEETLACFMVDGHPDPGKLARVIGDILVRVGRGGRKVRVFGEMVAVLLAQGNVTGALSLEDGWNGLAATHRFRLFCAYPSDAFAGDDTDALAGVCNRHSHVLVAP